MVWLQCGTIMTFIFSEKVQEIDISFFARSEQQHRNSTPAGRRLTSDSCHPPRAADSMNENHVTKTTSTTSLTHVNKPNRNSNKTNLLRPILHRHRKKKFHSERSTLGLSGTRNAPMLFANCGLTKMSTFSSSTRHGTRQQKMSH